MSDGEAARILVLDLRGERADVVRAILEPLGEIEVRAEPPGPSAQALSLAVVDPPARGLDETRLAELRRRLAGTPIVLLGSVAPPGALASGLVAVPEPLTPSTLRRAAGEALRTGTGPGRSWLQAVASVVPLAAGAAVLVQRASIAAVPVLLAGEPGTGKSRLARAFLTPPGGRFVRIEPPPPAPLGDIARSLAPGGTLYLSGTGALAPEDERTLLELLDDDPQGPRLVLGCGSAAPLGALRDDLRLRLEPVAVEIEPLRRSADRVPELFARLTAILGARHGLEPPTLEDDAVEALASYPWPLNFEELLATATGCLFRAAGRPAGRDDLGLPAARGAAASRPSVRPPLHSPRSLDALVQELGHEIKNPLVSIKTFSQLLPERFDDPEFREKYHRIVSADVERIDAVLGELAEFARLPEPRPGRLDLAALVRRLIEGRRPALRKRGIELTSRVPERGVTVTADRELLGYALEASLAELVGALPEGASVSVTLRRGGPAERGAVLEVRSSAAPETALAPALEPDGRPRSVLGLRHTLAAHALELCRARLAIEDTLAGETVLTVTFDEQP